MKRPKHGATLKQFAYAKKLLNAEGPDKKTIALSVGYAPSVANNVEVNIENTEGFANAVMALAAESSNMAMAVMAEYKARGLTNFSNKDLNGAMNAIGAAWDRFNKQQNPGKSKDPKQNKLKQVILNKIENQTNITHVSPAPVPKETVVEATIKPEGPGLDLDL